MNNMPDAQATPLPTRYTAQRGVDGTVRVSGVPIFAENRRDAFGKELVYDKKWLDAALAADVAHRTGGYKAPMHFGHHEVALERGRAGHFELERVEQAAYQGKPTWVVFGTLVFADEAALQKALKAYPYRSVEISGSDAPGEINSLALLSTEAPYFRFPNLENIAFAVLPDGRSAFTWRTPLMTDAADAKPVDAPDTNADFKTLIAKFDEFAALIKAHFAAGAAPTPKDEASADDAGHPDKGLPPIVAATAAADQKFAALEGALAATRAELSAVQVEAKNERTFASLLTELTPYGLPNLKDELRKRIKDGTVEGWAAGVKQVAPKPRRDEAPDASAPAVDVPAVQAFASQGTDKLNEARRLAALYNAAPKNHFIRKQTLEAYLGHQLPEEA